jgi:actin-related protein
MESIRFKTYEKELIIMKYTVDIPRRVSVITDGEKVADVNTNYIKAKNKPEKDPKLLNKMHVNTDSATNAKVTFVDPEKSDNEYSYVKEMLVNNIVLSGGTTMMPGFAERVTKELSGYKDENEWSLEFKPNVIADNNRYIGKWIGMSMIASMSAFDKLFIKKSEYQENGEEKLIDLGKIF